MSLQQQLEDAQVDVEAWLARKSRDGFPEPMIAASGEGVRKPKGEMLPIRGPLLLKAVTAAELIGWSVATFHRRKRDDPDFPPAIEVGAKGVQYYTMESITAYVRLKAEKAAAR